ncbi:MAG: monovalent cation:proton antiporter-2 (CPA2) family protein, partial [Rhodobiaceae bacterium]|nr:monovalent cation:proton antiporter-2 (CPA2) family protein [Rhodobiaceae bacterium]
MAENAADVGFLGDAILLMTAAVVAVPLFRRFGLGSILGYLAAGIMVGPVLKLIIEAKGILHFAEFGVVLLLFVIGLELKPSRLWAMRHDIFGLGAGQVVVTGILLALFFVLIGWETARAIVVGFGLALSSTAIGLQTLEERNERPTLHGHKAFSILLFQDLAIVPLIALISVLAPSSVSKGDQTIGVLDIVTMLGAIAMVILAGRYLLNPLFRILAVARAREIMTAAALLIVLCSALLMQWAGLSMAMGAFLAGVLLAESSFRHELEANIEPFRGLLLGLFFMAVGMSLNVSVILAMWPVVLAGAVGLMALKAGVIYSLLRLTRTRHNDAVRVALLLPQAGEFGFVLFAQAASVFLISQNTASLMSAVVTVSMALTPLGLMLY